MAGDLVIGYDGTDGSEPALEYGLDLAADLKTGVVIAFCYAPVYGAESNDLTDAVKEHGEGVLGKAIDRANERGIPAELMLINARPAPGLADEAKRREARLVVVGTRGEGPLRGAIIGSVPHKLLQLSEVPVLAVCAGD